MGLKKHIWTKRGAGTRRKVFVPLLATLMLAAVALGANASVAMALSPALETSATPAVAEKGATLKGTVNPGGAETKVYFEYGTTTSYGSKTAEVSVGSGTATLEHSQAISGLSPNTVYHYRIVAGNAFGSSQGIDQTFTTVGPPEVFTWAGEPHASGEGATLKAWIDANGQSTTYQFEYRTASSGVYTNTTPAESAGSGSSGKFVTSTVTGLMPGTKYVFRVVATNAGGQVTGHETSFLSSKSPGIEYTPASAISRTGATINADIEPREATKYYFEYGTTTSYGSKTTLKEIGSEPEVVLASQAISGLKANTLYHYRMVAENPSGTTVGTDQTFTTLTAATLYKGGTQLLAGTPLKAFSTNLVFSGESGSHGCTEAELSGTVKENPGAVQGVSTLKMQSGEGVGCTWKPTYSIKYSTPSGITIEYAKNGAGEGIAQSNKFVLLQTVYYEKSFKMAECEYNLVLAGTFKTATALEPTLSGKTETIKGGVYCPPSEIVSGKFAVTTGGAAVEAK